jgi:hypothetical protein
MDILLYLESEDIKLDRGEKSERSFIGFMKLRKALKDERSV